MKHTVLTSRRVPCAASWLVCRAIAGGLPEDSPGFLVLRLEQRPASYYKLLSHTPLPRVEKRCAAHDLPPQRSWSLASDALGALSCAAGRSWGLVSWPGVETVATPLSGDADRRTRMQKGVFKP